MICTCLFLLTAGFALAQETQNYRGSIPIDLLRPSKGEAPRYPVDTVIGPLGQGTASDAAFSYANWVAAGLLSGRMNHPALEAINPVIRENYLSTIGSVEPRSYRLGSGRQEPDESTSFIIRFIGKEEAITAEMYIRHVTIRVPQEKLPEDAAAGENDTEEETAAGEPAEKPAEEIAEGESVEEEKTESVPAPSSAVATATGNWMLEDLLLDEAKTREEEQRSSMYRMDYVPYERFF